MIVDTSGTRARTGDRLRIVGARRPEMSDLLSDLYDYDVVDADNRERNKTFGFYKREIEHSFK